MHSIYGPPGGRQERHKIVRRFLGKNPEIDRRFELDENFKGSAAEAWVPLKVKASDDEILRPFLGQSIIITYENSD